MNNPNMEMALCGQCMRDLRADGREVVLLDQTRGLRKARCTVCGKSTHTYLCKVSKEVSR